MAGWWSFSTLAPPAAFYKIAPLNYVTGLSPASVTLSWTESPGAQSYEVCNDVDYCAGPTVHWVATTETTATFTGLSPGVLTTSGLSGS